MDGSDPEDAWSFWLNSGEIVDFTASFDTQSGDIDLQLYDVVTGALVNSSTSTSRSETVTFMNPESSARQYVARLFRYGALPADGYYYQSYTLATTWYGPGCHDDAYEPSDTYNSRYVDATFGQAGRITQVNTLGYYTHQSLAPGATATVRLISGENDGDLDLSVIGPCGSVISSRSATDNEFVTVANNTSSYSDLPIEISLYGAPVSGHCQAYMLDVIY